MILFLLRETNNNKKQLVPAGIINNLILQKNLG